MLRRILAVAQNTRREAYRNRAFTVLLIVGVLLNTVGFVLSNLAEPSQKARVIQNFGYFAVSFVSAITAILIGVILLYKELDRKTIYTLIPKPVMRYEIVLGKFLGLGQLLFGLVIFLALGWIGVMWLFDALVVNSQSVLDSVGAAVFLVLLESLIVTSIALMFSGWTRPFLSGVFSFLFFVTGRVVFVLEEHLAMTKGPLSADGPLRQLVEVIVYVVPDLSVFNISREIALGIPVPGHYLWSAAAFAGCYILVFLGIGVALFGRRDFV